MMYNINTNYKMKTMKKINLLLIAVLMTALTFGQTTRHNGRVKIKNTPTASIDDNLLAINSNGLVVKTIFNTDNWVKGNNSSVEPTLSNWNEFGINQQKSFWFDTTTSGDHNLHFYDWSLTSWIELAKKTDLPSLLVGNTDAVDISNGTAVINSNTKQISAYDQHLLFTDIPSQNAVSLSFAPAFISANALKEDVISKVYNSVFIDAVLGNDLTAELENPNKPYQTWEAMYNDINVPANTNYNVYIKSSSINVLRKLEGKSLTFYSLNTNGSVIDFSNIKENDGTTDATLIFTNSTSYDWVFKGEKISIKYSNTVANKLNGGVDFKGRINVFEWDSPQYSYTGNVDINEADLFIKELRFKGSGRHFHSTTGNIEVDVLRVYQNKALAYQSNFDIEINNLIVNDLRKPLNVTLGFNSGTGDIKIGDITANGLISITCDKLFFDNSEFSDLAYCNIIANDVYGKTNSLLYNQSSNIANTNFIRFTGKLRRMSLGNGIVLFENCNIETDDHLIYRNSGLKVDEAIVFKGFNTVFQNNTSDNLIRYYAYGNPSYGSPTSVKIIGELKLNATSLGSNIGVSNVTNNTY